MPTVVCVICKSQENPPMFYGFAVCDHCQLKLGMMSDQTIKKHLKKNPSFEKDVDSKLQLLESVYARRKIKLLHIKSRLHDYLK